jgi:hypothetical protein
VTGHGEALQQQVQADARTTLHWFRRYPAPQRIREQRRHEAPEHRAAGRTSHGLEQRAAVKQ